MTFDPGPPNRDGSYTMRLGRVEYIVIGTVCSSFLLLIGYLGTRTLDKIDHIAQQTQNIAERVAALEAIAYRDRTSKP